MTDLLQTAVATGTGRAAQIGRPVAGKTGTTTANKDGWFIGFSSGITTGVWMGRDDAKRIPGLQGGRAPALAFHDHMARAVAARPVEEFETKVTLPAWEVEGEEGNWTGEPDEFLMVDPDGNPIAEGSGPPSREEVIVREPRPAREPDAPEGEQLNEEWLDRVTRRPPPPPRDPPPDDQPRP
jgi:penicillin-binding protein 1A